ncbi:conserved hypothetical protein [Ricinus communis]|uniref:Uncharacterized protein n=1 Tax=Ricinus communis TaxID=3988 RepID=B9S5N6_RICCO|nr:conserved hypothetical protein [Ricinus communis]
MTNPAATYDKKLNEHYYFHEAKSHKIDNCKTLRHKAKDLLHSAIVLNVATNLFPEHGQNSVNLIAFGEFLVDVIQKIQPCFGFKRLCRGCGDLQHDKKWKVILGYYYPKDVLPQYKSDLVKEDPIIKQLMKTQANISIRGLIQSLYHHCQAFYKALNQCHVPIDLTLEALVATPTATTKPL